jgi:hypothetical protein
LALLLRGLPVWKLYFPHTSGHIGSSSERAPARSTLADPGTPRRARQAVGARAAAAGITLGRAAFQAPRRRLHGPCGREDCRMATYVSVYEKGVLVYPATADGDSPPRILREDPDIKDIAIDALGQLYVCIGASGTIAAAIAVYDPGADAKYPWTRTISGDATGLHNPGSLALDSARNLYVPQHPHPGVPHDHGLRPRRRGQ